MRAFTRREVLKGLLGVGLTAGVTEGIVTDYRQNLRLADNENKLGVEVAERVLTDKWVANNAIGSAQRDLFLLDVMNKTRVQVGLQPIIPGQIAPAEPRRENRVS